MSGRAGSASTRGDWGRWLPWLGTLALAIFCVIWLSPILFLLITSFRTVPEILAEPFALPSVFSLHAYEDVWATRNMGRYFLNSAIVTLISLVTLLLLSSLAGFAFARRGFPLRQPIFYLLLAGLLVPGQVVLIPTFRLFDSLGLVNSFIPLIALNVAFGLPFATLVFTQFFRLLPRDIEDAAYSDGCSSLGFYWRILMPLSRPAIAAVAVLQFMWMWNDLLFALTFIHSEELRTVPLGLIGLRGRFITEYDVIAAGAILSLVPVLVAYVLFRRALDNGLSGATWSR